MNLHNKLNNDIVDFLSTLPNIYDEKSRQALIQRAGLDLRLHGLIDTAVPPVPFFQGLIRILVDYGRLDDGRLPLEAVLEASKEFVGGERQTYCDTLLDEVHSCIQSANTPQNTVEEHKKSANRTNDKSIERSRFSVDQDGILENRESDFDHKTSSPIVLDAKPSYSMQMLGIGVFILGIILILLGSVVEFLDPVTLENFRVPIPNDGEGNDKGVWTALIFQSMHFLVKSSPISLIIGCVFLVIGLLWVKPDIARQLFQLVLILLGIVVVLAILGFLLATFWLSAQLPTCEDLLNDKNLLFTEKASTVEKYLGLLQESRFRKKYTECAEKYKSYRKATCLNAVNAGDVELASNALSRMSNPDDALSRMSNPDDLALCRQRLTDWLKNAIDEQLAPKSITEEGVQNAQKYLTRLMELYDNTVYRSKIQAAEKILTSRKHFLKNFYSIQTGEYSHIAYPERFTYLRTYFKDYGITNAVTLNQNFSIHAGEVTVGDFTVYLRETGQSIENACRNKPCTENQPVEGISHAEAEQFARWLSQKTGRTVRLPTLAEWAAACVVHGENAPILNGKQPVAQLRQAVDHLLGNVSEWSSESCKNGSGFWVLGGNYMTDLGTEQQEKCVSLSSSQEWNGFGFRLVYVDE